MVGCGVVWREVQITIMGRGVKCGVVILTRYYNFGNINHGRKTAYVFNQNVTGLQNARIKNSNG